MNSAHRATAPSLIVVALAATLSGCSDDPEPAALPDVSSQACRIAAVNHASLAGPRASAAAGRFTGAVVAAYDTAIAGLSTAVAGEGEVSPEVTSAVVELVGGYSRTRAYVQETTGADSYFPDRAKSLTSAEERLYELLVEVCPPLEPAED